MNHRATIRLLPATGRLHLNDGPIDLIIGADGSPTEIRTAYHAASRRFVTILDELCTELPILRSSIRAIAGSSALPGPTGSIAQCMAAVVSPYRHRCFITPMAAVAGAVAEAVLAVMTESSQLDRAYVNNGGDIAFHLSPGQSYKIGMVERPENPSLFGSIEIPFETPVRGIATSGWRGRSFSLGIADAVTVLAETAAQADAAATVIANAVDLPNHPAITRVPAREISPDSDLLDLPVTRDVGPLSAPEIAQALSSGAAVAQQLRAQPLIHAAALCLQRHALLVPVCGGGLLRPSVVPSPRCATNERYFVTASQPVSLLSRCPTEDRPCPK
ncbi:MAG TPA: UPF0280 family protein [Candidatus Eremiobacteraceae bacterium]|nr:UPF0280 family protein [Candidatus Eremiobacteraceae bacterium]